VKRWRQACLTACAVFALAVLSLTPYLRDSAELVRLRNALLLDPVAETHFDWTPHRAPADFKQDPPGAATPAFAQRVAALDLAALPSDWDRALALARHLLANRQGRVGRAIQSDLEQTYQVIRRSGEGYCGDYADVYTALAVAAGLPVRSWAFSFDGFGGRGHIFNEVWDAPSGRWRMIDVFHNYVMYGPDGQPLSAREFRDLMRDRPGQVQFQTIEPAAKPVFRVEAKAREFYQRGLDEWYLWWGSAIYRYDDALLVRALGPLSRSLEQLGGIVQQVHPRIRVLVEDGNRARFDAMQRLQRRLRATAAVALLSLLVALYCAVRWWRMRAGAA
jgi:hypothetical protein